MAASSLRIIIATPRFFPHQGGVENHVYQTARRFAALGHQVVVYTANPGGALAEHETIDGIAVRRFVSYPAGSDLYYAPGLYRAIAGAGKDCDVVHVQNYLTLLAPLAMAGAQVAGIPYVVTFHGGGHSQSWRNAIRGLQGRLIRPLLRNAKRLIATARFEKQYYGERLGLPESLFTFISNGCDIAQNEVTPAAAPTPLIISIGRLERYKGHQRVLAAMPALLRARPDIKLRILGDGPYADALQAMTRKLGLTDCVSIGGLPIAERQRMADTLASASLVALMSDFETQPMAALEAIALGRPVIVADTSGLSELAENGWARAVPVDAAPETLAAAMLEQMAAGPIARDAIALPTWDECARDLLALYGSIRQTREAGYFMRDAQRGVGGVGGAGGVAQ